MDFKINSNASKISVKSYGSIKNSANDILKKDFYTKVANINSNQISEEINYNAIDLESGITQTEKDRIEYQKNSTSEEKAWYEKLCGPFVDMVSGVISTVKDIYTDIKENDNFGEYAAVFGISALLGLAQPIEQTVDCTVQATSELVVLQGWKVSKILGMFGADTEVLDDLNGTIKKWTMDFVGTNWSSKWSNDWIEAVGYGDLKNKDSLMQLTRGAEDSIGSVMLTKLPGPWAMIASAVTGEGRSAEIAYQQGATYEEAALSSHVDGLISFATAGIMSKISKAASGSTSVSSALGWGSASAATSVTGDTLNSAARYETYGKNIVDENGNKVYSDFGNYFVDTGDAFATFISGLTAFTTTSAQGLKAQKQYNYILNSKKDYFNKWYGSNDLTFEDALKKQYEFVKTKGYNGSYKDFEYEYVTGNFKYNKVVYEQFKSEIIKSGAVGVMSEDSLNKALNYGGFGYESDGNKIGGNWVTSGIEQDNLKSKSSSSSFERAAKGIDMQSSSGGTWELRYSPEYCKDNIDLFNYNAGHNSVQNSSAASMPGGYTFDLSGNNNGVKEGLAPRIKLTKDEIIRLKKAIASGQKSFKIRDGISLVKVD